VNGEYGKGGLDANYGDFSNSSNNINVNNEYGQGVSMKELSKYLVVKELVNSLKLIKKNPLLLITAALLDAIFFFAYGFSYW